MSIWFVISVHKSAFFGAVCGKIQHFTKVKRRGRPKVYLYSEHSAPRPGIPPPAGPAAKTYPAGGTIYCIRQGPSRPAPRPAHDPPLPAPVRPAPCFSRLARPAPPRASPARSAYLYIYKAGAPAQRGAAPKEKPAWVLKFCVYFVKFGFFLAYENRIRYN